DESDTARGVPHDPEPGRRRLRARRADHASRDRAAKRRRARLHLVSRRDVPDRAADFSARHDRPPHIVGVLTLATFAVAAIAAKTTLRERIGVDLGGRRPLEDGLAWAAAHGVHYVDACLEGAPDHPNAPATWTADRVAAIRATCERHRIQLGLHSASAVNVAETSPLLADAADQYLRTYIDLAVRLDARWIVVHGGYHFTGDYAAR